MSTVAMLLLEHFIPITALHSPQIFLSSLMRTASSVVALFQARNHAQPASRSASHVPTVVTFASVCS